jgi:hypothetical protein
LRLESQSSSALMNCYSVLEEAVKSWEYVIANKVVYFEQLAVGNDDPFIAISKFNAHLERWIELNLTLSGERKAQYHAVLRPARNGRHVGWKSDVRFVLSRMKRNPSVFIDVPEPVQAPQFRGLVSVPMVIWLKAADNVYPIGDDSRDGLIEGSEATAIGLPSDHREAGVVIPGASWCQCKEPSKMVKGASQTRGPIPHDECHRDWQWSANEVKDVLSGVKIILGRDNIGLAIQELPHLFVESAEVMLRPTNLHVGIKVTTNAI